MSELLSKHTYYRIGGPAEHFVIPGSVAELETLRQEFVGKEEAVTWIGLGSNILASDKGFPGTVIKLSRIDLMVEMVGERLRTGASVAVSSLLRRCAEEGWGGLEFLTGIPGSIGGVVKMNAGTHLGEAKDRLFEVTTWNFLSGVTRTWRADEMRFEYRKNLFLQKCDIVTSATWSIERRDPAQVKHLIDETLRRRKQTQPLEHPSCGSVFKNPKNCGLSAWQVIDRLGLRGHQIGHAQFSEKHPNFILNLGGAKASEVKRLIDLAKKRAQDELGIQLQEEVIELGVV